MCTTRACVRAAARILARLDPTVDPCDDFYTFSCGSFLETSTVPDDANALSTLQEMQDEMLHTTRSRSQIQFLFYSYIHMLHISHRPVCQLAKMRRNRFSFPYFTPSLLPLSFKNTGVLEMQQNFDNLSGSVRKIIDFYTSCMSSRESITIFIFTYLQIFD